MSSDLSAVPKAELHVHLEGTATPALVRRLAERNGMDLPKALFADENAFAWTDFLHFLETYDLAASVIRTPDDYRDVTYDYLSRCAAEGVVYCEMMSSPDHAAANGMSYQAHLDGIAGGIDDVRRDHGIEGFIIVTCVRHFGVERAMAVARDTVRHDHPLVVGFGMGGDELGFPPGRFTDVFALVAGEGLPCTVHAGEFGDPASIRQALDNLPVGRLGHGVRAAEDPALVRDLVQRDIVLECCPTSNIATKVFPDFASHAFTSLRDAGVRVTLNSDDPPYFHTSVGLEYAVARDHFGLDAQDLRAITCTALEAGFAPAATRTALIARNGLADGAKDEEMAG